MTFRPPPGDRRGPRRVRAASAPRSIRAVTTAPPTGIRHDPHAAGRRVTSGIVLALDLGASRIRVAAVTPDGHVIARDEARTPGADGPAAVVTACIDRLRAVATAAARDGAAAPVGIGISAVGPLDARNGILVEPPNVGPGFRNIAISTPVADALALPVSLERDTNVAALAEQTYGAARGATDFLYLTVSTGIGG